MKNNKGFTLIELLISIGIAGVVLAAAYTIFMGQNNSYKRQEQITEMQQNLRAAMTFMTREIRMAGANPLSVDGLTSIDTADTDTFHFTLDVSGGESDNIDNDDDGAIDCNDPSNPSDCNDPDEVDFPDGSIDDPNEDITYTTYDFPTASPDGDNDIGRNTGGGNQLVVENIDVLNFVYLDGDGNVLATPVSIPQLSEIRAVEITIVARTPRAFPGYTDTTVYTNQQGDVILDKSTNPDGFRRRMASSVITCRNI